MRETSRDMLLLDGQWKIFYDHDNTGKEKELYKEDNFYREEGLYNIDVPSSWEEFQEDYEGVAWYARKFHLDGKFLKQGLKLKFEAVNYLAEIYVNGFPVGYHKGGYIGFELDIEDFVKVGSDNFLAVRVVSPIITKDIIVDGIGKNETPHWRAALTAGIYQSVSIEGVTSLYIQDVFVEPQIDSDQVNVHLTIYNRELYKCETTLSVDIIDKNKVHGKIELTHVFEPGKWQTCMTLDMVDYEYWSIDNPQLYWCHIVIQNNQKEPIHPNEHVKIYEDARVRFGMRSFSAKKQRFTLNGEEIYLKAVFHECLYPHKLATPADIEIVKRELTLAKEAGINLIRPWRRPLPSYIYDIADEIGMMFVGSIPVECMNYYPELTPYLEEQVTGEFLSMIQRDRNHASLVVWELFNEIHRLPLKRLKHKISIMGRDMDPSRIIFDESGGFAGGANLYLPYSKIPTPINDVHSYPGVPLSQFMYDALKQLAKNDVAIENEHTETGIIEGALTNVSELGYGSLPNLEANMKQYYSEGNPKTPDYKYHERLYLSLKYVLKTNGLDQIYSSVDNFCKATQDLHAEGNKYMIEACRLNDNIGGLVIHAYTDADWIVGAGLLDIYRNPKKPYYTLKQLYDNHYVALRSKKPNYYVGEKAHVEIHTVNDLQNTNGTIVYSLLYDGSCIETWELTIMIDKGVVSQKPVTFDVRYIGTYILEATVTTKEGVCFQNSYIIHGVEPVNWGSLNGKLTILERGAALSGYFRSVENVEADNFNKSQSFGKLLLIGELDPKDKRFKEALTWIQEGGTAIYLDLPLGERVHGETGWRFSYDEPTCLPVPLNMVTGKGLWVGRNHVIKDHPVFDGLPSGCMVDNNWMNLAPERSLVDYPNDWLMGLVSYDWFDGLDHLQDHRGVDTLYSASDMVFIGYGKGRVMLNTLPIAKNLYHEPFAVRLLYNIARNITRYL